MQMKYDGKKSETKKSSFVLVRKYQIVKRIECKINVGTIRAIKNSSHCHHHKSSSFFTIHSKRWSNYKIIM